METVIDEYRLKRIQHESQFKYGRPLQVRKVSAPLDDMRSIQRIYNWLRLERGSSGGMVLRDGVCVGYKTRTGEYLDFHIKPTKK